MLQSPAGPSSIVPQSILFDAVDIQLILHVFVAVSPAVAAWGGRVIWR